MKWAGIHTAANGFLFTMVILMAGSIGWLIGDTIILAEKRGQIMAIPKNRLTIYLHHADLIQFIYPAPKRPADVTVIFHWRADSEWPVELAVDPNDYRFREMDAQGGTISFGRDLTEAELKAKAAKLRAEAKEIWSGLE